MKTILSCDDGYMTCRSAESGNGQCEDVCRSHAESTGDGRERYLLRECRAALDDLLKQQPMWAAKICGSTTLGNLRAMLRNYKS